MSRACLAALALVMAGSAAGSAVAATVAAGHGPVRCVAAPGTRDMWQELAPEDVCRVVAFGTVGDKTRRGAVPPVAFQLQSYARPGVGDEDGAGIVLFRSNRNGRRLMVLGGWSGSGAVVEAPRLVQTRQGPVLVLPMTATVSARPSYDTVFRVVGRRWVQLSTDGWDRGVHAPRGTAQRTGPAMDWPGLRAFGTFSRPGDANCCPTGGSYIARLRLTGTRLTLGSVRYARGLLPFP